MLIPIGHENMTARRWPVITIGLIIANVLAFVLTMGSLTKEPPGLAEVRLHIQLLAAMHPDLTLSPVGKQLVDEIKQQEPLSWTIAQSTLRPAEDEWDRRVRQIDDPFVLQQEMDQLCARYDELQASSFAQRWTFVPARSTWYTYITANFLHGGWLHLIGNMWFLWLAGIVLEEAWGRPLYLVVYLLGGIVALQVHAWFNPGSHVATLGASGAVAALMGAFLVRFPKVQIQMIWFWGFFRPARFTAAAYWLLPFWFLMEIFYGTVFGASSGVAHMAHVGGFIFGACAAMAIHYSGLEHAINRQIEDDLDPLHDSELDDIQQHVHQGNTDHALTELDSYDARYGFAERSLQLRQELYWRTQNLVGHAATLEKLCALHLGQQDLPRALEDYQSLVNSGGLPSSEVWLKLCHALEERQEYERALGEYQELAQAYPQERNALMALLSAARIAMNKVKRPDQAVMLYQAASASPVPHMDLDSTIQFGITAARTAAEAH